MAKLKDLVNVNINRDTITIQGKKIPVIFSMLAFPYIEEAYGKPYHVFEKDLNIMLRKGKVRLGKNELRLMYSLIYAMVRAGGTECTPKELEGAIPFSDLHSIFETVLNIFNNQHFQKEDMDKLKKNRG